MLSTRRFTSVRMGFLLLILVLPYGPEAAWGDDPHPASPEKQAQYEALGAKKLHEFNGNTELAQYLAARKAVLSDRRPGEAEDIAHFALMGVGQPYKRAAIASDLSEADCVTFTERCVALACTDSWEAAYKLQNRLRYKEGKGAARYLNHDPIAEWIPNNAWLFDDITESLGAPLVEFDVVYNPRKMLRHYRRSSQTPGYASDEEVPGEQVLRSRYIPKQAVAGIAKQLRTGDVIFVIGQHSARPVDPVIRPRCIHQAIIHDDGTGVGILHSTAPSASRWTLERLFGNPSILGCKFVRLKPNARQIVTGEFNRIGVVLDKTPEQKDQDVQRAKSKSGDDETQSPDQKAK